MKTRRRLFAFLFSMVMLFSLATPAWADELIAEEEMLPIQFENYAYNAMKRYIGIHGLGSNLTMTQPIPVCNGADNTWNYFLFDDTECLGMMTVAWVNGAFTSSFCAGDYNAVEPLLANSIPFALTVKEDSLLIVTENTASVLEGPATVFSTAEIKSALANTQAQVMRLTGVELTQEEQSVRSASCSLNVDIVANLDHPDISGRGLCWAASAASVIRYWNTSYPTISALTVYHRLCALYGTDSGYPYGTTTWIGRAFDAYDVSMVYVGHGTNYATVKNIIENLGYPIVASLTRTGGAHNVVISGFTSGYGHYYYVLVDSNKPGIVTAEVTDTSANTFTYPAGKYTYTNWQYYYY